MNPPRLPRQTNLLLGGLSQSCHRRHCNEAWSCSPGLFDSSLAQQWPRDADISRPLHRGGREKAWAAFGRLQAADWLAGQQHLEGPAWLEAKAFGPRGQFWSCWETKDAEVASFASGKMVASGTAQEQPRKARLCWLVQKVKKANVEVRQWKE